jgi:hypothetical protein
MRTIRKVSLNLPGWLAKVFIIKENKRLSSADFTALHLPHVHQATFRQYISNPNSIPCPGIFTDILNNFPEYQDDLIAWIKAGGKNNTKPTGETNHESGSTSGTV